MTDSLIELALRECANRCRYDGDLFADQQNPLRRDASWEAMRMAEEALAALTTHTAVMKQAEKALEPFAKEADVYNTIPGVVKTHGDVELWQRSNHQTTLTVDDLRRARQALSALKELGTTASSLQSAVTTGDQRPPTLGEEKTRYPVLLCGDQIEFEREHANTAPEDRPDWPLPSFDATDWAKCFCKIATNLGYKDAEGGPIDEGWMIGWFANALMRGFDEYASRVPIPPTQEGER